MNDANRNGETGDRMRAAEIFQQDYQAIFRRTDRLLMALMVFQWFAGVAAAIWISPATWEGASSHIHPHVWAAIFFGGIISSLPITLAGIWPGRTITRHALAVGQMMMSALLIHVCGGRIETHFHIFGSLAFLSFYRDWRVLITASLVVAADHFARGMLWPESIYGVLSAPVWRAFEHAGWVVFEDVFLILSIHQSVREMRRVADRQAELESSNTRIERTVAERTAALTSEIAERRQAEAAVRSSEKRFSQLAEAIPDVFWITSKGMQEIIYVSPAYEKIWGRTLESLRQRPQEWADAILEEDRAGVFEKFTTLPQSKGMVSAEYRIRRSDGEVRWIQDHGFPIYDEKGEFYRVAGVARDITERKQMEARLFEVGKLETVGRLAAGIAHDFNTILTTVIGHAELIADKLSPGSSEFQSATQIGVSAGRAALLTQQLLAFSRKQMLQPEVIDLNAAVKDADLMLRRFLGDAIEVRIAINAQQPLAKVDLGQIRQMLVQLASNARDAMPTGGRLTLETADMTLDENYAATHADVVAGDFVMIAISDTGAGIAPEVKPHLFEPFFTTKPQGEGTGLGLAMCYGIAKQNGGHISVYSEPGHGTTFKIFLPRIAGSPSEAAEARAPIPKETPTRGSESVLLVEDDDGLRDLAGIVLGKLGYTVHPAANGAEAIRIAENHGEIALLLTDVVMPRMSGKELADRLCALRPAMKVLFTSAFTEDAITHHGILDEGIDFLHKPYTPALLSRKTRAALDAR